jgi:hypothetical protein
MQALWFVCHLSFHTNGRRKPRRMRSEQSDVAPEKKRGATPPVDEGFPQ